MAYVSSQIKRLQEIVGVTADGIFGPNTLRASAAFYNLTPCQAAHLFGQLNVETAGFTRFVENLNYSAARLREVFPKYFTELEARQYAGKPQAIANRVYANRMGNGSEQSGNGWDYRGRGFIQLTGKANYSAFARFLGNSEPIHNPDCIIDRYAFAVALWYFSKNGIWDIAKKGVTDQIITQVTKKINGGTNGLASRKEKTLKYYGYLK